MLDIFQQNYDLIISVEVIFSMLTVSFFLVNKNLEIVHEERKWSNEGLAGDLALESLLNIEEKLFDYAKRKKPMVISQKDRSIIRNADRCHICEVQFQKNEKRCRDHVCILLLFSLYFTIPTNYYSIGSL